MNHHTPKATPTLGDGVPVDSRNFKDWFEGSKLNSLWRFLYHWKALGTYMFEMGSHCSFGHLKHKLWPKEGLGVKLPVWLLTRKSRESTRFTWLQMTCHIPLESSWRELQLFFRLHFNLKSSRKVMGLQSPGSPSWRDFRTPTRESHGSLGREKPFGCEPVERSRIYYKGEGDGFSQVWAVVSLVCPCCPWLVLAPKVLQLCTNHFVWVVCRPMWMNKLINSS